LSNLKQIGLGMMMYAQDYDEISVPWVLRNFTTGVNLKDQNGVEISWDRLVQPYTKNNGLFACPSDGGSSKPNLPGIGVVVRSYSYPGNIGGGWTPVTAPRAQAAIPRPADTLVLVERDNCGGAPPSSVWEWCAVTDNESETAWRHSDRQNVV